MTRRSRAIRVWCKPRQKYLEIAHLDFDYGRLVSVELVTERDSTPWRSTAIFAQNEVVIEWGTGLKDKNGKEICEGDIVKGEWLYGYDTHVVRFEDGGYYPFCIPECEEVIIPSNIEVIGNIHENPELLEGEK